MLSCLFVCFLFLSSSFPSMFPCHHLCTPVCGCLLWSSSSQSPSCLHPYDAFVASTSAVLSQLACSSMFVPEFSPNHLFSKSHRSVYGFFFFFSIHSYVHAISLLLCSCWFLSFISFHPLSVTEKHLCSCFSMDEVCMSPE